MPDAAQAAGPPPIGRPSSPPPALREAPTIIVEIQIPATKSAICLTFVLTLTKFRLSEANRWIDSLLLNEGIRCAYAAASCFRHRSFFPHTNSRAAATRADAHCGCVAPVAGPCFPLKAIGGSALLWDPHGVCAVDPLLTGCVVSKEGFACRSNPSSESMANFGLRKKRSCR